MRPSAAQLKWAAGIAAAAVGIAAWPLATGAGLALALAAVFAGLRAVALLVVVLVVVLAAAGLRIDADSRAEGARRSVEERR